MHLQYGSEEPLGEYEWMYSRIVLAQEFGWTLEYIDSLSYADVANIYGVMGGQVKQRQHMKKTAKKGK